MHRRRLLRSLRSEVVLPSYSDTACADISSTADTINLARQWGLNARHPNLLANGQQELRFPNLTSVKYKHEEPGILLAPHRQLRYEFVESPESLRPPLETNALDLEIGSPCPSGRWCFRGFPDDEFNEPASDHPLPPSTRGRSTPGYGTAEETEAAPAFARSMQPRPTRTGSATATGLPPDP
ncbi:hypothetical protein DL766_007595 [Monosporascus sp. MC13-8B]|uniref:Uncharacterized protein n=1 Tax=Monosporascus cannonballus TaxID=155416 RepID=A0ABY0HEB9_9PEZI|nr:hypothetical protein DL763_011569 [Monosporascus cannonballus]RYO91528.1 hypothetical protein DL762_002142 [Monosporascus cannonballus]RYP22975.1 hypothetical protein DL766_007595 [Monosporascus sp. MC13-8B]